MGLHRIVQTKFDEAKDSGQLPISDQLHIEEFLTHIKRTQKIPGVEIIQGVIEFHPETGYWTLCTQRVFPFDIGNEPYQEYDGTRASRAYARVRASLGPDEIARL